MDFLNNTNVRHAIFLVAGTFLGYFGTGFMSQDSDVDQVAVVDSIPAVTADAVLDESLKPAKADENSETPAEAPTVE